MIVNATDETEYFFSQEEANNRLSSFIDIAESKYEEYIKAKTEEEKHSVVTATYKQSFVFHMLCSIIENPDIKDYKKFPEFGYRIEQAVILA